MCNFYFIIILLRLYSNYNKWWQMVTNDDKWWQTNAEEVSLRGLMSMMMDPFGLHSPFAVWSNMWHYYESPVTNDDKCAYAQKRAPTGGGGTVDRDAVASNCPTGNCLSSFNKRVSSNNSNWQIWTRWGFPTVACPLPSRRKTAPSSNVSAPSGSRQSRSREARERLIAAICVMFIM